ncbi:MAG: NAD(P)/FAD-dependent oxidoreductase [bacterium]
MWDVAVAGGGPAGCMVAGELARRGFEVCLLEKEKIPRKKPCGGGLPPHTVEFLRKNGIDYPDCCQKKASVAQLYCDFEDPVDVDLDSAAIQLVDRTRFDARLVDWARQQGAGVVTETAVEAVEVESNRVIFSASENIRESARFFALTCGPASELPKKIKIGPLRAGGVAMACHLPFSAGFEDPDKLIFNLLSKINGYGWVFPKKDHLNVGIAGGKTDVSYPCLLKKFIKETFAVSEIPPDIPRFGFLLPFYNDNVRFVRGRVAVAGDAGGFVDPVTGEGIYYALKSGKILANAIETALRGDRELSTVYRSRLEKHILPDLRRAGWLARLLYGAPGLFYKLIMKRKLGEKTFKQIARGDVTYRNIFVALSREFLNVKR